MPLRRPPSGRSKSVPFPDDEPTPRGDAVTQRIPVRTETPPSAVGVEEPAGVPAASAEPPSVHERLLHAARERFATDGYENATTAAIVRQAGTSESQLVKHFGSKAGLLEAIFDATWSDLEVQAKEALRTHPSPVARLLALGDLVTRALGRDTRIRTILLLEGRRIRKNASEVIISAGFRRFLAMVDDLFRQMSEQGDFVADVHLQALRSAWIGAMEALVRDQLLGELMGYPATFDHKVVRRTAILVLSGFLTPRAQRIAHSIGESR